MKMEQIECSETSANKIQTPGNYPEESIQHSEHGKSLKSRKLKTCLWLLFIFVTYFCNASLSLSLSLSISPSSES
jgi:hypothetical protein